MTQAAARQILMLQSAPAGLRNDTPCMRSRNKQGRSKPDPVGSPTVLGLVAAEHRRAVSRHERKQHEPGRPDRLATDKSP